MVGDEGLDGGNEVGDARERPAVVSSHGRGAPLSVPGKRSAWSLMVTYAAPFLQQV